MYSIQDEKLSFFQILILILSLYVIGALIVSTFFEVSPEELRLLNFIDYFVCVFFFIDFVKNFRQAKNKLKFMKWGWIELISCLPAIDYFMLGRTLRIIKIIRIIRAFRSTKLLIEYVFKRKTHSAFASAAIIAVLMIIFSSISVLHFEDHPNSNIKSAEDALWWSYCTISTVGFGDRYPVTSEGRIIAVILMTTGVGLFGTFTGYIASLFVQERQENSSI